MTAAKLPEVSNEAAVAYHGRVRMTLTRDIQQLLEMEMIIKVGKGYLANKTLIEAFLPARAKLDDDGAKEKKTA